MRERRAYIILVVISILLSTAVFLLGLKEQDRNNHRWCQIITVSLSETKVKKPANPNAHTKQAQLYRNYQLVVDLSHSLGCS